METTDSIENAESVESLPTDTKLADAPVIPREDSTPTVSEQADSKGFHVELYNFGKLEGDGAEYFNPSIVERPDGLWMLTRRSEPHPQGFKFGQNAIWAFMLDETGKVPKMGKLLRWPVENPSQHFEDPRGFYHPGINQVCVGACTFLWYREGGWTGAHQIFGAFEYGNPETDWMCRKYDYPRVGGNHGQMENIPVAHYEKNWLWWLHENKLHLLYKADPWQIIGFDHSWNERTVYRWTEGGVRWSYGDIRGGTNPVKVGDYYFTFHHSSLPWRGRYRRYYAGCMAFDARPPFRPRWITREPLLIGSQNDSWVQHKPLVVFPCGAICRLNKEYPYGMWLVTLGVNDMRAAWMEIVHDDLMSMMSPVDKGKEGIFFASGLSDGEQKAGLPAFVTYEEVPIGGTGTHGIKCTCIEKDFPCPFHFRDNEISSAVPVLAEPTAPTTVADLVPDTYETVANPLGRKAGIVGGEARESTDERPSDSESNPVRHAVNSRDSGSSRGGRRKLSPSGRQTSIKGGQITDEYTPRSKKKLTKKKSQSKKRAVIKPRDADPI